MVAFSYELPQYLLLDGISWSTYEMLLREMEAQGRHLRVTYDRERLEIMGLSHRHEFDKTLLGRLVEGVTLELDIPIHPGGSTTFKKELLKRGLEADECYWVQNEPLMRKKREFDIEADPPPDLAIEVEITRSALDRMGIYAALRIPEVWRFDGERLRVFILGTHGKYKEKEQSKAFPFLPMKEIERFLLDTEAENHTALMRSFHEWVRTTLAPKYAKSHKGVKNGKRK